MARLKGDMARAAAVDRIDDAADRCTERTTSGKGKGHEKGKGHGREGPGKRLAKCLKKAV